jgi:predicted nucleic acid-binding protein
LTDGATLYLDTSALVRLYTTEPGRDLVLAEMKKSSSEAIAHEITYVEAHSALSGRLRRKLLSKSEYTQAVVAFETDWANMDYVTVDQALIQQAGDLVQKHPLRAFDAVHLAAAIALVPLGVRFMTFDRELWQAAATELPSGLLVII